MNFTSSSTPLRSKLISMLYFYVLELFPFELAIFLRLVKTLSIVNGSLTFFLVKIESRVLCPDFEF